MNLRTISVSFFLSLLVVLGASCSSDLTGESSSDFCKSLQSLADPNSTLGNLTFDDPKSVNQTIADLIELAEKAPPSISKDAQAVASLYEDILLELVSVSPNQRTNELRKFQAELDEVTTGARALELYGETECGLVFTSPFEPTPTPVSSKIEN
ncbi:MAG: hypothetical protein VX725_03505 [Actinomycetota bacterium]|nr:hypothetical protein [Actinomycetota bacterium]